MKRALILLRDSPVYRRESFAKGVQALGYTPVYNIFIPRPDDILIVWNRYAHSDMVANSFQSKGAKVLVTENCLIGKDFLGGGYLSLFQDYHNGAGRWPKDEGQRWESFSTEIKPYIPLHSGEEIILLPQRSIGPLGVAMPRTWVADMARHRLPPARVRHHPGKDEKIPLLEDLREAKCVVTWGSGAAIKALLNGYPCISTWDKWIGAKASTPIQKITDWGKIPQPDRLKTFQRIAMATWRYDEIESGEALLKVLEC